MATNNNDLYRYLNVGAKVPVWKKRGYSSEADYLKAMTNAPTNQNTVAPAARQNPVMRNPNAMPTLERYAPFLNAGKQPQTTGSPASAKQNSLTFMGAPLTGSNAGNTISQKVQNSGGNNSTIGGSKPFNPVDSMDPLGLKTKKKTTPIQQPTQAIAPTAGAAAKTTPMHTPPAGNGGSMPTLDRYKPYLNDADIYHPTNKPVNTGSYNGTSDFLEAFKQLYGYDYDGSPLVRREGMSDGEWNALQVLYRYHQQGKDDESKRASETQSANEYYDSVLENLKKLYSDARQGLDASKARSQQNASISLDKLMKYLPAQAQAQGYTGTGAASSSALRAYANYNNSMGNIAGDYNTQMTSLNQDEANKQLDIAGKRRGELADINDKYGAYARDREHYAGAEAQAAWDKYETERKAYEEQLRQEARADERLTYDDYKGLLQYTTSTDAEVLKKGIAELDINDELKGLLEDYCEVIAERNRKAEADKKAEKEEYDDTVDSDNANEAFSVYFGTLIDSGDYEKAKAYLESAKDDLPPKTYAEYKRQLDSAMPTEEDTQEDEEDRIITGEDSIEYDGANYKLTGEIEESDVYYKLCYHGGFLQSFEKKFGIGLNIFNWEKYVYDSTLIPNGTTLRLEAGKYVTFYNGNWYWSKRA